MFLYLKNEKSEVKRRKEKKRRKGGNGHAFYIRRGKEKEGWARHNQQDRVKSEKGDGNRLFQLN